MDNSDITQNSTIEPKDHHKIIINEPFSNTHNSKKYVIIALAPYFEKE